MLLLLSALAPSPRAAISRPCVSRLRVQPAAAVAMQATGNVAEDSDALHASDQIDALFEMLASADATDDELAWRIARAHHDKAEELQSDDKQREKLLREGLAVACASMERTGGSNGYALKWYAILLGRLGDFLPTKEKVANSFKIKDSLEASARLLPDDASVLTALGQWCFKVAGISGPERFAAKLLFGSPPQSSYAEALGFLEKSYELRPSKKAALFAGLCQGKLGERADAREWMERCLALESSTAAAVELDRQAQAAL